MPETEEAGVVATLAKGAKKRIEDVVRFALGHKTRAEILMVLNDGIYTVQDLAKIVGVPRTNIGNHLQKCSKTARSKSPEKSAKGTS
jgi:DNA-binding transcriptional ArsR family regulator